MTPAVILLLGPNNNESFAHVIKIDFAINILFIMDYFLRLFFTLEGSLRKRISRTAFELVLACLFFLLSVSMIVFFFQNNNTFIRLVQLSALLKFIRMFSFFSSYWTLKDVLFDAVNGFILLSFFLVASMIVYCVIGVNIIDNFAISKPDYGTAFSNRHYNFINPLNAWVTLMTISTGNGWTGEKEITKVKLYPILFSYLD